MEASNEQELDPLIENIQKSLQDLLKGSGKDCLNL